MQMCGSTAVRLESLGCIKVGLNTEDIALPLLDQLVMISLLAQTRDKGRALKRAMKSSSVLLPTYEQ